MKILTVSAIAGAFALIGLAAATPASALPAIPLAPAASDISASTSPVEQVRWRRAYRARPYFGTRRGWHRGYRRPGPIRRLLRHL